MILGERLRRTAGLALLAAVALPWTSRSAVPDPPDGQWAATTVALLRHGHERCAGVADGLLAHWRRLRGDGPGVSASLDRFVLTRATADLAAARQALDLARGFLPRAALEVDPVAGAALDRLYEAETELCTLVALPAPPIDAFQRRLDEIAAHGGDAERELGERLTLPRKGQASRELAPYLGLIETAATAAQQRMLADREVPPPPRGPTLGEKMAAWHLRYSAAVPPSKLALRAYLEGRRTNDAGAIQQACKDLLAAVIPLLADEPVFQTPDPEAGEPLLDVYTTMRRLAVHCTAGRFREADDTYERLERDLAAAGAVLSKHGLRP